VREAANLLPELVSGFGVSGFGVSGFGVSGFSIFERLQSFVLQQPAVIPLSKKASNKTNAFDSKFFCFLLH